MNAIRINSCGIRDRRYSRVPALTKSRGILDKAERLRLVPAHSNESGVQVDALFKWLRMHWQGGQTAAAVIPADQWWGRAPERRQYGDE